MGSVMKIFFILLCSLVAGIWAQDIIPEVPIDFPPPTTTTTTTEGTTTTTKTTTIATTLTTEASTSSTTESTTTLPTESTTKEPTTISTTEGSTTTKGSTTTEETSTTEESTTTEETTRTEETTTTTTTFDLISLLTPKKITKTLEKSAEKCYLKSGQDNSEKDLEMTTYCYRCCYNVNECVSRCQKLHKERCSWSDFAPVH